MASAQEASFGSAGRIELDDVHAYPESMGQWDLDIKQLSTGRFEARIEYVEVAGMLLYREHFSHRTLIMASSPADAFLFGCSRSGYPELNVCGKYLQYDNLAFCHPGTEVHCITPDMDQHVVLEVPRHRLEQIMPDWEAESLLKFNRHMKVNPDKGRQFIRMIDRTISTYVAHSERLNDVHEYRAVELQLMDQLTDLILHNGKGMEDTPVHPSAVTLGRALDCIQNHHRPITIPELAAAIETTPRTLQRTFHEILKISPLKYQRMHRMNAAHKALRSADRSTATVTDIALAWGFTELGRFACQYRQLFGESPATTLARSARHPTQDLYSLVHV
jgi:AraC family ethanolamine operon transcriptional activator